MAFDKRRNEWLANVKGLEVVPVDSFTTGDSSWFWYGLFPGRKRMIRVVLHGGIRRESIPMKDFLWMLDQADKKGWKTVHLCLDLGMGDTACMLNPSETKTNYDIGYSGIYVYEIEQYY